MPKPRRLSGYAALASTPRAGLKAGTLSRLVPRKENVSAGKSGWNRVVSEGFGAAARARETEP